MARSRGWPPDPEPFEVPLVDNHTHLTHVGDVLDDGAGDPGVAAHLRRAAAVGVGRVLQVGCDLDSAPASVAMAAAHPKVLAGVAIHPNEAPLHDGVREVAPDGLEPHVLERHRVGLDEAIAQIAGLAGHERVRTIAETGLDFFRTGERGRASQHRSFREHIALAKELDLPMQVHDREAHAEILAVLDADGPPPVTVLHCFSGDADFARECAERGFFLSFAGTVTFKNAHYLREAALAVPVSQLLVESDAPFLTPHPWRGAPNGPYLVPHTVRALAQVRGEDPAVLGAAITRTSEEIYGPW
ncbi:TatD family hydrolase [Pseudactinotalea sp. Z1748]|uniref:TatD family hydrolase n=1 Tax=Pseudactinotalea sp. Z1748 TaxID=3413027 RepID=UPI003C7BF5AB